MGRLPNIVGTSECVELFGKTRHFWQDRFEKGDIEAFKARGAGRANRVWIATQIDCTEFWEDYKAKQSNATLIHTPQLVMLPNNDDEMTPDGDDEIMFSTQAKYVPILDDVPLVSVNANYFIEFLQSACDKYPELLKPSCISIGVNPSCTVMGFRFPTLAGDTICKFHSDRRRLRPKKWMKEKGIWVPEPRYYELRKIGDGLFKIHLNDYRTEGAR